MFKLVNSCRLCRSYENINTTLHHIDSDNLSFFQKLNRIAPGILENNDNLPDDICTNCITELNISYKFINKCSESQAIFQRYLEQLQNGQQVQPANHREILIKVIKLEESYCSGEVNSNNSVTVKNEKETGFINEELNDKHNVNDYANDNSESNQVDFQNDIKIEEEIRNILVNLKNENIEEICNDSADDVHTGQRGNEVKLENNYSLRPSEELKHLYDEDDSEFTKIEDRIDINIEYGFTEVKNIKIDEDDFEKDIDFTGFDLIECDLASGYKVKYDLKLQSLAKEINKEHTKNVNKVFESSAIEDNSSNVNINIQLNNAENIKNVHTSLDKSSTRKLCQNSSKDSSNVKVNNRSCTVRAPYMCKRGKKARNNQSDIIRKICTDKNSYECKICGKDLTTYFGLTKHIRTHTGEKSFQCETCKKAFARKGDLIKHIRTHTGEKPYQCKTCKKAFTRNDNLIKHIRIHTGEKPYQCKTCKKAFARKGDLIKHIRTHTGEKPYHCKTCKKAFTQNYNLIKHIRTHTGERPFQCKTCKKAFASKGDLMRHIRTHTGEKPYQCKTCKKTFSLNVQLTVHIRTHTGEKPYHCKMCKKAFAKSGHLTRHIRIHTGEKPFQCKTCNKAFTQNSVLIKHIRTHTGEKPYQCKTCKKTLSTNVQLTVHIRTHTGEKPYHCKKTRSYTYRRKTIPV